MAKKKACRPKVVAVDPTTLGKGDTVKFGASKAEYHVEWTEVVRGRPYVVVFGPLGSPSAKGGQSFYVGTKPTTRVDPLSGKRKRVPSCRVFLVAKARN